MVNANPAVGSFSFIVVYFNSVIVYWYLDGLGQRIGSGLVPPVMEIDFGFFGLGYRVSHRWNLWIQASRGSDFIVKWDIVVEGEGSEVNFRISGSLVRNLNLSI